MLHEILLSLSGHPSPLLAADHSSPTSILSPPEKGLLSSIAHLSNLHCKILAHTANIATSHTSCICQAVATAIKSTHLARFQRKVLEVEDNILRKDAGMVGAYNIVPLTAIVGEFSVWTRRMEWFLEVAEFMIRGSGGRSCSGAMIIDRLCEALKTGYIDIEEAALSLVSVAETAWLKQVSAWVLYGRLPSFGMEDFFVQVVHGDVQEYHSHPDLLPAFVSGSTASSLLFIGRSLNHIRVKGVSTTNSPELELLSSHLQQLSSLKFPINSANFSQVINSIRVSLSQTTLQKLLPLSKVIEILTLLREYFLLGRGEFAIALITEADDKIRSRWRRSDNLGYDKRDGLGNIVVKDGEVSAALARTWAALGSLQGQYEEEQDEDELLELARDLVQLNITKSTSGTPSKGSHPVSMIAPTPFRNLLFSVPVILTLDIPSPLDLFLTPADVQSCSSINAYLLSIHRAHIRLTDLWKITSLRRDHPAPPGPPYGSSIAGRNKVRTIRSRGKERSQSMRSVWATSSAAVFFLGETEAYLQGEVVQGTWEGFKKWLSGESPRPNSSKSSEDDEEDIWLQAGREPTPQLKNGNKYDPQTLADAHRRYLSALATSLLLTNPSFTDPLYHLLQQIDHLVALVYRVHSIWQSLDLEADEGVVDAFSDFHKEEKDIKEQLVTVAARVKSAIENLVQCLRNIDQEKEGWENGFAELVLGEEDAYIPAKVGRVDRLLMKLDFGGWFDAGKKDMGNLDGLGTDSDFDV
ncbi:Spc97/Spc98 family protein [Drepanopeziza brunnea f. sp. 'multigermtubi' MB_m1]|uniref:Spindle pole body component n=2 Tax=Drepanopeziza brunnea f. sp. 'multigermtubi' TaxID=698441 RepID=K1X4R5_MARBU|nr:Spc97/Spc98 family protein [Drepanopeziza brunnea f. sp. 'multigermtubi' MB_m1]EKD20077.1 Spc97/Spc98 family protein [Drepanopeziza brunnea f. sp. 'multigermtubi' MB_m1]